MTPQRTHVVLTCFRIGDPDGLYPIYDDEGSRLYPGRWNTAASPMVYTSEHYSTAMLEKLVHANAILPPNQHFIRITIPNGTRFARFPGAAPPGWAARTEEFCKPTSEERRVGKEGVSKSSTRWWP